MYKIIAFMPNGQGIAYEVSNMEWTAAKKMGPNDDYVQFQTTRGSFVRLNLRMYMGLEFQFDNGLLPALPPLSRPS